ncbi:C6 transcription factor [Fusarium agapanthi]|uniref:C6 transcription factor n=1 Tax=Fusarium agapanthi TaxID=1803897 RepID=A0A9P5BAH3_9HYPO|nr:C6 transcription factor [Fusarium agapanthi]
MESNKLARTSKSLHIRSQSLIFANVWDLASLNMVLCLDSEASKPVKAIATASWAIAASLGMKDKDLTMEHNLASIRSLAPTVASAGLPLSVDLQDGYGSHLREAVTKAIQVEAHGANIEDSIPDRSLGQGIEHSLYPLSEQIARLQLAGLPDLKDDAGLDKETRMKEALKCGKAYLDAGATTVFFWRGYGTGFTKGEVQTLVNELGGCVEIRLVQARGALSTSDLGKLGVARISIGPSLFQIAMHAAKKSALSILEGGCLEQV